MDDRYQLPNGFEELWNTAIELFDSSRQVNRSLIIRRINQMFYHWCELYLHNKDEHVLVALSQTALFVDVDRSAAQVGRLLHVLAGSEFESARINLSYLLRRLIGHGRPQVLLEDAINVAHRLISDENHKIASNAKIVLKSCMHIHS
jgi:hypothetical protein